MKLYTFWCYFPQSFCAFFPSFSVMGIYVIIFHMNYIVFDLEWNQPEGLDSKSRPLPFEIIEIGAVRLNENFELVSKFSRIIKPQVYNRLNRHIVKMLSLKPGELEKGGSFENVAGKFLEWCGDDYIFCTWGNQDLTELQRNMNYYTMAPLSEKPFRYIDVQRLYSIMINDMQQYALETAVDRMKIVKDVQFHRAYSDAYYTSKILKLISSDIIEGNPAYDVYHLPASKDEEIHVSTATGYTTYSRAFNSKEEILEDQVLLTLWCPVCKGRALKRKINWFNHSGKNYHAAGKCPEHGYVTGLMRIRPGELGGFYAEKITSLASEHDFLKLSEQAQKVPSRK